MNAVEKPAQENKVESGEKALESRKSQRANEKEFKRLRDLLSSQHELSRNKVYKKDGFNAVNGKETLADLFDGLSESIVHQFMLGAGREEGFANSSPAHIILTAPLFI